MLILAAAIAGCVHPPGSGVERYAIDVEGEGSSIRVAVDAGTMSLSDLRIYTEHGGSQPIVDAIVSYLVETPLAARPGSHAIELSITSFRLRSSAVTGWLGLLAGSDTLSAAVEVTTGETLRVRFPVRASTGSGWIFRPSSARRFERLVDEVGRDVADGLRREIDRRPPRASKPRSRAARSAPPQG